MMVMFTFPLSAISEEKYIICPTDKIEKGNAEILTISLQGCIFRLTCSYPELTKDHVLTSAYVKILESSREMP